MTARPVFRKLLQGANGGEKVLPALRAALYDPDFPSFNIHVEGWANRPPDGWFHPSTHPLWPERMLYYYLMSPQDMVHDPFDPTGTIAVTLGSFLHSFVQIVGVRNGILERQPERCGCGTKHPERAEIYLEDREAGSRGHADGALVSGEVFEFKSMNPAKAQKIPEGDPSSSIVVEAYRSLSPGYYLQAQEYLRMSGRESMVTVVMGTVYPFPMREVHIPYDRVEAMRIREKYLRVRQAVADQRLPLPCCSPGSKQAQQCPAREVCPIGRGIPS